MPSTQSLPQGKTQRPPKLKRLPDNARIQKRPLLHPPIPSPYRNASQSKVIYVSTKTPFVSVVKRVRKLLSLIDKRAMGKTNLINSKGSDKQKLRALTNEEKEPEEVLLKATGRAVEKVLGLGLYFQGQDDIRVRLRTGSAGAVDDIVEKEVPIVANKNSKRKGDEAGAEESFDRGEKEVRMVDDGEVQAEVDLPETQIRKTSVVEVGLSLR